MLQEKLKVSQQYNDYLNSKRIKRDLVCVLFGFGKLILDL